MISNWLHLRHCLNRPINQLVLLTRHSLPSTIQFNLLNHYVAVQRSCRVILILIHVEWARSPVRTARFLAWPQQLLITRSLLLSFLSSFTLFDWLWVAAICVSDLDHGTFSQEILVYLKCFFAFFLLLQIFILKFLFWWFYSHHNFVRLGGCFRPRLIYRLLRNFIIWTFVRFLFYFFLALNSNLLSDRLLCCLLSKNSLRSLLCNFLVGVMYHFDSASVYAHLLHLLHEFLRYFVCHRHFYLLLLALWKYTFCVYYQKYTILSLMRRTKNANHSQIIPVEKTAPVATLNLPIIDDQWLNDFASSRTPENRRLGPRLRNVAVTCDSILGQGAITAHRTYLTTNAHI